MSTFNMHRSAHGVRQRDALDLIGQFAVLGAVESEDFVLFGHAQPDRQVDELEDDGGQDTGVGRCARQPSAP